MFFWSKKFFGKTLAQVGPSGSFLANIRPIRPQNRNLKFQKSGFLPFFGPFLAYWSFSKGCWRRKKLKFTKILQHFSKRSPIFFRSYRESLVFPKNFLGHMMTFVKFYDILKTKQKCTLSSLIWSLWKKCLKMVEKWNEK